MHFENLFFLSLEILNIIYYFIYIYMFLIQYLVLHMPFTNLYNGFSGIITHFIIDFLNICDLFLFYYFKQYLYFIIYFIKHYKTIINK